MQGVGKEAVLSGVIAVHEDEILRHLAQHAINLGFQEQLPENVRLGDMRDWGTVPSTVRTAV
jgi:hypothetical protein